MEKHEGLSVFGFAITILSAVVQDEAIAHTFYQKADGLKTTSLPALGLMSFA